MSVAAPSAPRTKRVWFVDIVRLLASLQMVNGHTLDAVLLPALKQGAFFDTYDWGRGLVSVCFLMVAGIAFHLSTLARYERHRANPAAIWRRFRRALLIIAAGYFLGFPWAADSPDPVQAQLAWTYFFAVGILHSIGAALLLLEALTLASRSARQVVVAAGLLTVGFFALAPLADASLEPGRAHPLLNWISHAGGSAFPLLPWAGNVFAGVVIGAVALPGSGHTPLRVVWSRLAMLTAATWILGQVFHLLPWTLLQASSHPSTRPAFAVENLAAVLFLTLVLSVVSAPLTSLPRRLRILSSETLSMYVFHLVVLFGGGVELARRIGPTLDLPKALALAMFVIALTSAFALSWHGFKAWRAGRRTDAHLVRR
ncbi:MAG: DUF1624 domain-containing protein [Acidobacteria bacterium]|nr:DUF1624 domain-containing protein [Acidobacteriota bacterium]